MFELIRANKRKSGWLIAVLGSILIGAGYAIGFVLAPEDPGVQMIFVFVALGLWIVMLLTSVLGGEKILLSSAQARQVEKADAPQLFNVVEEMCIASGLSPVPRIFLIDSPDPNAFAVGLKPERAAVAVTTGLMGKLNRDELQSVVAHEIAHIQNRDTLFMTLAGVTVGAVIILGELFWRSMLFGGRGRSRGGGRGGNNQGAAVMMIVAVVLAILAPILARILYFACSRRREYLADACAAQYTRYPEGLASALQKISGQAGQRTKKAETSQTLAPMYIINPLAARGGGAGWFSTHPATDDRIKILRGMTSSASLEAYEAAYKAQHPKEALLKPSMLEQSKEQAVREKSEPETGGGTQRQWRETQDLLHKVDKYAVLACMCGMKLKLPPDYEENEVTCPKCGRPHAVPPELFTAMAASRLGAPS